MFHHIEWLRCADFADNGGSCRSPKRTDFANDATYPAKSIGLVIGLAEIELKIMRLWVLHLPPMPTIMPIADVKLTQGPSYPAPSIQGGQPWQM